MKKAEIKRRKRVVPAANQQHEYEHEHDHDLGSDQNQEEQMSGGPYPITAQARIARPAGARDPIPVDFTDTFRTLRTGIGVPLQGQTISIPSKRSLSGALVANDDNINGMYPHDQNVSRNMDTEENIDPSLPSRGIGESEIGAGDKETRRADLLREAEKFRRMLEEKERELAELG